VNQAWELLYDREPELYDRLTEGETLHPGIFGELAIDGVTVLDIGAGSGRLTLPCAARAARVLALEPAAGMRRELARKLERCGIANVTIIAGKDHAIPLPADSVDVTVSCAAFGADPELGGEVGLAELRRVTRPGGEIFVLWPDDPRWFLDHGFSYHAFAGPMEVRFRDLQTAELCAQVFYGEAALEWIRRSGRPAIPYSVLGVNAPRDLCRCGVV
jgi:ubiquinone/menaquinone biosynthesis C-methylase UbiE